MALEILSSFLNSGLYLGLEPVDKTGMNLLPIHPNELRARQINWLMKRFKGLKYSHLQLKMGGDQNT